MKAISNTIRRILPLAIILLVIFGLAAILLARGVIWFNMPSQGRYPVRGVDVSHYQGTIDWEQLAAQNIQFAFIKATEGSGTEDECFAANWDAARKAGIHVGAYHFFSFDSLADTQAQNFIHVVPAEEDALPPVIDLEFYRSEDLPEVSEVQESLRLMLALLEKHYGKTPIIYTTDDYYKRYLEDADLTYTLWIRSIFSRPAGALSDSWRFWQYNPRGLLEGYTGAEKFIDLNVYRGSKEEFIREFSLSQGE